MSFSVCAVDIFCGVGGLTRGLTKAGIPVVAGIDTDEACRYPFTKNNDAIFVTEDVRKLEASDVSSLFPEVDFKVLVGCAPCQCFSKHTHKIKNKHEDDRWRLLDHFSRLIRDIQPSIVSMENVPELTKHGVFRDFVDNLVSDGYKVSWKTVFCPDYGIPQQRTRLVLLASRLGEIQLLPETHAKSNYRTVRDVIGNLEPISDGGVSSKDALHRSFRLSELNKTRIKQSKPGGTWLDWSRDLRCACHRKSSGRTYSAVYGRMSWDKPAPTITTQFYSYGTGRFGHPEQHRALSLREGALLQTFPRKYKFLPPRGQVSFNRLGVLIGNAVPVRLGEIIGRSIMRHLKDKSNG